MEETIQQIYDKMFKKILTLSSTAVINLINGLFDTSYPLDSTITYNWTEFEDDELNKTLADTILTINNTYSYHMEAQMTYDGDLIFRVFDYGYNHAKRISPQQKASKTPYVLMFPEPKIIYLFSEEPVPKEYTLRLSFGTQGYFDYTVSVFDYLDTSIEELNRKKMVILIPFELLRLRETLKKERTPENLERLKSLILNDIIGSINENLRVGNITPSDARHLKQLTQKLYAHLYAHYEELEAITDMTDQSLVLEIDIIEREHEHELRQKDKIIAEKDVVLAEKDAALVEKDAVLAKRDAALVEKDAVLAEKDAALAERDAALVEKDTALLEKEKELEYLRSLLESRK